MVSLKRALSCYSIQDGVLRRWSLQSHHPHPHPHHHRNSNNNDNNNHHRIHLHTTGAFSMVPSPQRVNHLRVPYHCSLFFCVIFIYIYVYIYIHIYIYMHIIVVLKPTFETFCQNPFFLVFFLLPESPLQVIPFLFLQDSGGGV